MKCPKCGNTKDFIFHQEQRLKMSDNNGKFQMKETFFQQLTISCEKCNTFVTKKKLNPILDNMPLRTNIPKPPKSKTKRRNKVSIEGICEINKQDFGIILSTVITNDADCSKCDAKKQGRNMLMDAIQKIKLHLHNYTGLKVKIEEIN